MLAFQTTPAQIVALYDDKRLDDELAAYLTGSGYKVNEPERRSWRNSLPALARHLCALGYSDLDALVEYQLPRSSRRIDVILAGADPLTMRATYLIVELKQWSEASRYDDDGSVLSVTHLDQPQLHPALQVEAYCAYLVDYVEKVREWPDAVHGMAYLHNAKRDRIPDLMRKRSYQSMVWTPDKAAQFQSYFERRFDRVRHPRAALQLLTSPVRQSTQLLSLAADEVTNRAHFPLLDEQRAAYELVLQGVRWAEAGRRKRVVVISGGPGSGKSAIGLNLLAELAREERQIAHATGSRAFTRTLQQYARRQPADPVQRTRPLFNYFMDFMDATPDKLDVLICDEAHRIRERSTKGSRQGSKPQVQELIEAAKVPVFLLDDNQVVRPDEVGSVDTITEAAGQLDLEVDRIELGAQFRCGGSPRYERWVLHLLGLARAAPYRWKGDERFRLALVDSPEEMETILRGCQDRGETARISAGFCWPWTHRAQNGRLVPDVRIESWARPWNAYDDYPPKGIPTSAYWATDPRGFGQIGCIYTAQGFEYNWSGVIIGKDLVVRDGRFVSDPRKSCDPAIVNREGRVIARNADRLIRNTYKVLLTRGLRGTLLFADDPETQDFLSRLIPAPHRPGRLIAPGVQRIDSVGADSPTNPHVGTAATPAERSETGPVSGL
ncbi:DNA/RNA helicase domain-containing protein [Micromonospora sp. NPDC007208]|uniref:DNA/RNA helicase domain-containing protein n=1 Tax=Micromonospora sp. NPDC007208 TaxID=3364236 RepID=UPI003680DCF5